MGLLKSFAVHLCSRAHCVCTFTCSMLSVFLNIMLRFTDRVSHSPRSQKWPHSYYNHHRPNPIRAYQVTHLTKHGATEPFITAMHHVITMMTLKILKFIFWLLSILKTALYNFAFFALDFVISAHKHMWHARQGGVHWVAFYYSTRCLQCSSRQGQKCSAGTLALSGLFVPDLSVPQLCKCHFPLNYLSLFDLVSFWYYSTAILHFIMLYLFEKIETIYVATCHWQH